MKTSKSRKKVFPIIGIVTLLLVTTMTCGLIYANEKAVKDTISKGVFLGELDVSGMDKEEAEVAVSQYMDKMLNSTVTFVVDGHEIEVPVSVLGFYHDNKAVLEEAFLFGKTGNVIKRYKENKQLEKTGKVCELNYGFDQETVKAVLENKCTVYNVNAVNAGLKKTSLGFQITEGIEGRRLDVEQSLNNVMDFLENEWKGEDAKITLVMVGIQPKGTKEDLSKVKDLLGTATTSYKSSSKSRSGNIERGASLIEGTVLYPGEEFSTYGAVNPISLENGYFMAPSYENGKVVETPGGGICQVSTTLYNAVLKAELEVIERSNHSMVITYAEPAMDAAIAGTYKDLKFINNTDMPIYIEGITAGKQITFNIYGVETRSPDRKVEYVSEVLKETEPTTVITAGNARFGSISTTQTAHKGCVARLWKVVYENGAEVSRQEVNKSTYSMSPKYISVGTAGATEEAAAELSAAIAANNEAAVRSVISRFGTVQVTNEAPVDADTVSETDTQQAAQSTEGPVDDAATGNVQSETQPPADTTQTQDVATTELPEENDPVQSIE